MGKFACQAMSKGQEEGASAEGNTESSYGGYDTGSRYIAGG